MNLATTRLLILIFSVCFFSGCSPLADSDTPTKIVILAGKKSHGPGEHEYIKSARLIKAMLDQASNVEVYTEIYYDGWPEDPAVLDLADLILTISDGQDGDLFSPVPFMLPERMEVMKKQMARGCGFGVIHFSTFAPDNLAPEILDWSGGYFDWQDETGARNWYSAIKTLDTLVEIATPSHPIANGLAPKFSLKDEYYYQIRFRENDPGLIPLLEVPALKNDLPNSSVVAWAKERENGGRGFSTTMGHFFSNWQDANFRKLMLNGIVWAAGLEVPKTGVEASYFEDRQVTETLYRKTVKGLILTGNDHPAHDWKAKTKVLKDLLEVEKSIHIDVSTDIEALGTYTLSDYDFLLLNYCNWEDSTGLSEGAKKEFVKYLETGGGLMLVHFANGAWNYSLPGAGASDWPEYRNICRRYWDHNDSSGHDVFGKFVVAKTPSTHPITLDMKNFEAQDELYYNQRGEGKINPLLIATSKDNNSLEPMAWTYSYGEGKVFQTVLGHAPESLEVYELQRILRRAALWVSDKL
ncbi:MAG: ThuA domain-containing protein [Bacteroidia bacterium]|nr:ThuA domain-containing protein [Bacteroidia bacterium]